MALTATINAQQSNVTGSQRVVTAKLQFDNSYPTGGYAVLPKAFGLAGVHRMAIEPSVDASSATSFIPRYNPTTGKVSVFKSNGTTNLIEVTNGTDLSAQSAISAVFGF